MPTDDKEKISDNQRPIDDGTKININTNVKDDVTPPTSNNNNTNKEKNDDGTLNDDNNNNNTHKKRPASSCDNNTDDENNNNNENKKARKTTTNNNDDDAVVVVDMADQLGYKAGDRLEVKWELSDDKEEEDVDGTTTTTRSHWWGCTLLEYDGRTSEDGAVAIRVLHYDAYPEGRFPDSSKEDVYFITPSILLNNTGEELMYRREGEEATLSLDEQDLRDKLNGMLMNILQKHSASWDKLDASKKAHMAELMSKGKESIIRTIQEKWEKEKKVILAADIPEILQDAFQSLNQPQQE